MNSTDLDREAFQSIGRDLLDVWSRMQSTQHFSLDQDQWAVKDPATAVVNQNHLAMIFLSLVSKSSKTFQAVMMICREDLGDDAMILVRTLIETYTTLQWIVEADWESRLLEHMAHATQQEEKNWDGLKKNPVLADDPRMTGDGPRGSDFMQKVRARLGEKRMKELRSTRPDGSVEASLTRWNRKPLYDGWYRFAATSAHGNDHFNHVTLSPEDILDLGQPSRWTVIAMFGACSVFGDILELMVRTGSYSNLNELLELRKRLAAASGLPQT